ncbi:hypothetical protein LJC38_00875, partial [Parabacteroides sp. OttesenSCG-928-K15]|nr:hypothetical protein [Parabacteroides sp. OttesenSCG-928-K15]
NEKLLSLLSEQNNFDSVLFIFDGSRRYKFSKEDLGIGCPSDLLIRNRGVLSLLNPLWEYYLYPLQERYTYSIDSLCGKVLAHHGHLPQNNECHVFIDKNKHQMALLYSLNGEYISIHRRIRQGVFCLKRKEFTSGYRPSHWAEICRLLSEKKETKTSRFK